MDACPLYTDPELYDLLFPCSGTSAAVEDAARRQRIVNSEQFYLEEAGRTGGRILELGCGSGRLTVPLRQNGIDITGLDSSRSMLEAARAKASAADIEAPFVEADMRSFELPGSFQAIFIPGNSLLHLLAVEDLRQCLAAVRQHLAPGGRLVFDISNWAPDLLARDPARRYPALRVTDVRRGEIGIEETARYDTALQIREIHWFLSAPGAPDFRVIRYRLRAIFPQELCLLLETAGFRLEERFGEFPREPFESSSPRQVCICS